MFTKYFCPTTGVLLLKNMDSFTSGMIRNIRGSTLDAVGVMKMMVTFVVHLG
jgi:hypothetical protein